MKDKMSIYNYTDSHFKILFSNHFFQKSRSESKSIIEKIHQINGASNIYIAQSASSLALCGFYLPDKTLNRSECWILESESSFLDVSFLENIISFLLYEGFYKRKLHKISFCIKNSNTEIISAIKKYQFSIEGILKDHFLSKESLKNVLNETFAKGVNELFVNGVIVAIMEKEFYSFSTGIVPFLTGFLIIRATNNSVFEISVIKTGENLPEYIVENEIFREYFKSNDDKVPKPTNYENLYTSSNAYPYLNNAVKQVFEYVKGTRKEFDLNYEFSDSTNFQKLVWEATMQIPYGQTKSYEEISAMIKPEGKLTEVRLLSRAVGTALGKNAVMIAIPCHRVIGKNGKLKGFAGGLEVKDYLLNHEMLRL